MDRNAKILDVILQRSPRKRVIGKVRLQKIFYLADLLAWRALGRPISEFKYVAWDHGPFDSDIYLAIDCLEEEGLLERSIERYQNGNVGTLFHSIRVEETDHGLSEAELVLVDAAIKICGKYKSTEALCKKVIYVTAPMQDAEHGDVLNMEQERNTHHGLSLETVLESRAAVREGRFKTVDDLLAATPCE